MGQDTAMLNPVPLLLRSAHRQLAQPRGVVDKISEARISDPVASQRLNLGL